MRWNAALFALGTACSLVACSKAALADGSAEKVRLSFVRGDGAEACFAQRDLEARVKERLGRDPFASDADTSIEAFVTRGEHGYTARLFVRSGGAPSGAREIASEAADCAPLEAAVTLAVALAIDPEAALRATPAPPIVVPPRHDPPAIVETAAPRIVVPLPPIETPRAPPPPATWHLAIAPGFATTVGLIPGFAPGLSLATELRRGPGVVRAVALWFPEERTSDGGYGFGLAAGELDGCVEPWRGDSTAIALCGGVVGGAIHAVPFVHVPTEPGERGLFAFDAGARLELAIAPPFTGALAAEALVPVAHYRFLVEGLPRAVYEQAPVAGIASISLGVSFP